MNGREHLFWGLMAYSICLFVFTLAFDYKDAGWMTYAAVLACICFSCLFNEFANILVSRVKRINRERNKERGIKVKDDTGMLNESEKKLVEKARNEDESGAKASLSSSEGKMLNVFHAFAYFFLGLLIVLATYTAMAASDIPGFIIAGYLCTMGGAWLPDLDKTVVDIRYHRNPFTHSSFIVLAIGAYAVIAIPDIFVSLMLCFIGLLVGNAAHLLCDNIESEGSLADIFSDFKNWKECPGDIRIIREDRERAWLNMHAFFLIVMIVIMFARFNFSSWAYSLAVAQATYDPASGTFSYAYAISPSAWILVLATGMTYLAGFAAFIAWNDNRKPKSKKQKEKPARDLPVKTRRVATKPLATTTPAPKKPSLPPAMPVNKNVTKPGLTANAEEIKTGDVKPAKPRAKP
jgi:VanZ family protein